MSGKETGLNLQTNLTNWMADGMMMMRMLMNVLMIATDLKPDFMTTLV